MISCFGVPKMDMKCWKPNLVSSALADFNGSRTQYFVKASIKTRTCLYWSDEFSRGPKQSVWLKIGSGGFSTLVIKPCNRPDRVFLTAQIRQWPIYFFTKFRIGGTRNDVELILKFCRYRSWKILRSPNLLWRRTKGFLVFPSDVDTT